MNHPEPPPGPDELKHLADGLGSLLREVSDTGLLPEIEGFTILRLIGEGGMGTVYEAWQERPRRRVALKLMRPGLTTPALLRRFHLEADILGLLEHPAIARVYEAGTASLGGMEQPYLTMELIEGLPLTTYVEREALSLRDRVSLLIAIADGVHFAHQKGVIHRDLKPANILVDPAGQPKILDFGIARMVTADPQATLPPTGDGRPVGTLATMAPEQARGDTKAIDTQSDVYALGVIAYRILTGQYPFALHELPTHEAIRILLETEPARPGDVNPALRGDLDVIMRKAMAKDKTQRYASAAALADDWRHYLRNEPIAARPPSAWYQARMFARRNKIWVGASAAVLLALITGALLATVGLIRARQAEQQARANLRQALDTVDQFTAFVAEGQLAGIAEAAPAREQLLRDAVFFYEQLLTANPGDARLQDELSWALARLAQANKSAGDFDNARSALEKRITHLIDLRRREPENRTHLRNLARARFELTHVLDKANDQAAARAVFSEAYTLYGELLAIDPDDRDLRMEMAYLLGNWSRMLDDDAARLRLEEARDLWAVLHDDYPRDDAIARATAWVNHRIGMLDGQPAPSAETEEGGWFSATDVEALMNAAGKTARVRGRIQEINLRAGREELTFLDFGREREAFTAIIHRNVLSALTESFGADLDGLAGRDVEVSGLIALYRGKPQMALRDPGAIMVVPSKTTPPATARTGDLDATDLVALRAAAGREVTVRGVIKRVGESRTRTLTFLDFEDHNRQKMSGIIHQDDLHRIVEAFGGHPKEALLDREITITGRLYLHRENPNIRITESGQIRVISGR